MVSVLAMLDATLSLDPRIYMLIESSVHAYWILCTAAAIVALLPPWHPINRFRNAVIVSACRGKLTEDCPRDALGPLSNIFVPQKWFAHFYAIGCVSNAVLMCHAWNDASQSAMLLLGLFQLHVVRRLLETVCMMQYPKEATMHVMAYAFGMSYYVVVPITYLIAARRGDGAPGEPTSMPAEAASTLTPSWSAIVGIAVFAAGSLIQWHAHYLLAHLGTRRASRGAKEDKTKAQTRTYRIPRGGLFDLVSCPHYLGETVIYLGLGVACGAKHVLAWYPLVWVIVNLTLAAGMTHQWYLAHFKTYRRLGRKAFIPYIY